VSNYAYATYQAKDSEGNPIDHPSNGQKVIGNPNGSANALTYVRSEAYGQGQKKIGNAMEKFLLSNINTVTYKNFTLNVQVDAKIGGDMLSASHQYNTTFGATANTLFGRDLEHGGVQYEAADGTIRTDGIIPEGVLADDVMSIKPGGGSLGGVTFAEAVANGDLRPIEARRYYRNISNWGAGIREYSVFENSWVSLREISVGYNVPAALISKLKLQTLRLSVTGRNLAYLYRTAPIDLNPEGLKSNYAAEFSEYGGLPMTRQMGFSLTAGF
jgi:iron complex outermembrane receptor protein